jgi:hypothetical protein
LVHRSFIRADSLETYISPKKNSNPISFFRIEPFLLKKEEEEEEDEEDEEEKKTSGRNIYCPGSDQREKNILFFHVKKNAKRSAGGL